MDNVVSRKKYIGDIFSSEVLNSDPKLVKLRDLVNLHKKKHHIKQELRRDVERVKLNKKNNIYVGSDNKEDIKSFKTKILPKLKVMFKDNMGDLRAYIELSSEDKILKDTNKKDKHQGHALNECYVTTGDHKYGIIHLDDKEKINLAAISHELIHASRCSNKQSNGEHETVLENVFRIPLSRLNKIDDDHSTGYYGYIGGKSDVLYDKNLIDSKCKNSKNLRKCIKKNIKNTKIGHIKKFKK